MILFDFGLQSIYHGCVWSPPGPHKDSKLNIIYVLDELTFSVYTDLWNKNLVEMSLVENFSCHWFVSFTWAQKDLAKVKIRFRLLTKENFRTEKMVVVPSLEYSISHNCSRTIPLLQLVGTYTTFETIIGFFRCVCIQRYKFSFRSV